MFASRNSDFFDLSCTYETMKTLLRRTFSATPNGMSEVTQSGKCADYDKLNKWIICDAYFSMSFRKTFSAFSCHESVQNTTTYVIDIDCVRQNALSHAFSWLRITKLSSCHDLDFSIDTAPK